MGFDDDDTDGVEGDSDDDAMEEGAMKEGVGVQNDAAADDDQEIVDEWEVKPQSHRHQIQSS